MKEIIIIENSPHSSVKTVTKVRCESYKIYKFPPYASYDTLEVKLPNGNIETWIHMTEVREVVWIKPSL